MVTLTYINQTFIFPSTNLNLVYCTYAPNNHISIHIECEGSQHIFSFPFGGGMTSQFYSCSRIININATIFLGSSTLHVGIEDVVDNSPLRDVLILGNMIGPLLIADYQHCERHFMTILTCTNWTFILIHILAQ